jgi:hypothetical protein
MDIYQEIAKKIIKEQQIVIGPLAVNQANKVAGLHVKSADDLSIEGNGKEVIGKLVEQYAKFFGDASIIVCKDAAAQLLSQVKSEDMPDVFK